MGCTSSKKNKIDLNDENHRKLKSKNSLFQIIKTNKKDKKFSNINDKNSTFSSNGILESNIQAPKYPSTIDPDDIILRKNNKTIPSLNIISATYDGLDCTSEIQSHITNDELQFPKGVHLYALKIKPHYYKTFMLTYNYKTEDLEQTGIYDMNTLGHEESIDNLIQAPIGSKLHIINATIDKIDVTEEFRLYIIDKRQLNINECLMNIYIPTVDVLGDNKDIGGSKNGKNKADMYKADNGNQCSADSTLIEKDRNWCIKYRFQSKSWMIECEGDDQIFIPSFNALGITNMSNESSRKISRKVIDSVPNFGLIDTESPTLPNDIRSPISTNGVELSPNASFSYGHVVTSLSRFDDITNENTSGKSASYQIKVVPTTMKGYINKENEGKTFWSNRYFVLDSTDALGHLAYYAKASNNPPYGKDLRGQIYIPNYTVAYNNEFIIFTNKSNQKQLRLEIKDEEYRNQWIHAIQDHMSYCTSELR